MTVREADWELVTPSPRSAGQTGADRANVFLLRCAELLNGQREERPAYISFPDRLWMNQSLSGQRCVCVGVRACVCESVIQWLCVKHWLLTSSVVLRAHRLEKAPTCVTRIFEVKRLHKSPCAVKPLFTSI